MVISIVNDVSLLVPEVMINLWMILPNVLGALTVEEREIPFLTSIMEWEMDFEHCSFVAGFEGNVMGGWWEVHWI